MLKNKKQPFIQTRDKHQEWCDRNSYLINLNYSTENSKTVTNLLRKRN